MIYSLSYEYNCQGVGGWAYILAQDWGQARSIAQKYLEEEYLWDQVGNGNMTVELVTFKIAPGALLLYLDD